MCLHIKSISPSSLLPTYPANTPLVTRRCCDVESTLILTMMRVSPHKLIIYDIELMRVSAHELKYFMKLNCHDIEPGPQINNVTM